MREVRRFDGVQSCHEVGNGNLSKCRFPILEIGYLRMLHVG